MRYLSTDIENDHPRLLLLDTLIGNIADLLQEHGIALCVEEGLQQADKGGIIVDDRHQRRSAACLDHAKPPDSSGEHGADDSKNCTAMTIWSQHPGDRPILPIGG